MTERSSDEQKRIVAAGYDQIAEAYARASLQSSDPAKQHFAELAIAMAPDGGRLVDLGCGTGEDVTAHLHPHFNVTGIDISPRSIALARQRVPGPEFLVCDMAAANFAPGSLDVVTAFYSLIHLPREELAAMLTAISGWLRPPGVLIATMGATAAESYDEDWLGAPMSWSHWDAATNEQLVRDSGLRLISVEQVTEPDGSAAHLWVVAEKR